MKWSWKIGEFAGIGVYIHATFLLIIAWVILIHWLPTHSVMATLNGVIFILALFACVLLHEFGHALTAKKYNIKTKDITLYPIGGVARLERMPDNPVQELWVALAGPAVNAVIAAVLYAWLIVTQTFEPLNAITMTQGSIAERLMIVNIVLVLFNMLPAFPMDGGRVLRAILATRMEYTRATHIAAIIGQGMAMIFGFWGLIANPFMLFIAFFVWIGAAQESSLVQVKHALSGIPVYRAMITDFHTLEPGDSLAYAVELILQGSQQDFPVTSGGNVVGILTRGDLLDAIARSGQEQRTGDVMNRQFQLAHPNDMLETAFQRLQECHCRTMPVINNEGQLIGLITTDNLGEFIMIQSAISQARKN